MRIALIHSFYSSSVPSGENFMVQMQAAALAKAGHEVRVIAARTDDLTDTRFYQIRTAVKVATGHGLSPLEEIRSFEPDIVHVHNLFPNYSTQWLNQWDGPIVATMHNFRPLCSNGLLFRDGTQCTLCPEYGHHNAVIHSCYKGSRLATLPIAYSNRKGASEDPVISRANKVIVLSNRSLKTYEEFGSPIEKFEIVPNYIEASKRSIAPIPNKTWVYAGRLTQEKGVLDLIDKWPDYHHLTVAGAGPDEDHVREIADKNPFITFLGSISRESLLGLLPGSQGFIVPSLCAEGLPTVYLEALSAGIPVIARKGNSAADDIDTWSTGLTYTKQHELQIALDISLSNYSDLARAARSHFNEHYTENAWLSRIMSIYKSM